MAVLKIKKNDGENFVIANDTAPWCMVKAKAILLMA